MAKRVFTVLDAEKEQMLKDAIRASRGSLSDAAYRLGISRQTVHRWIKKYDLYEFVELRKEINRIT